MSLTRVSTAFAVRVDEFDLPIVSGTLEYNEGNPPREVTGQDTGDQVYSENWDEAKGMIKFDVRTTKDNADITRIIEKRQIVTISFADDNGMERVMAQGVSLNTDPYTTGADGKKTMQFEGMQLT